MSDHFSDERLSAYLDGELTADEVASVEEHLRDNPESRRLVDELRALRDAMQSLPKHELDNDFSTRVLRKAEREMLADPTVETPLAESPIAQPVAADRPRDMPHDNPWRRFAWPALVVAVAAMLLLMVKLTPESGSVAVAPKPLPTSPSPSGDVVEANATGDNDRNAGSAESAKDVSEKQARTTTAAAVRQADPLIEETADDVADGALMRSRELKQVFPPAAGLRDAAPSPQIPQAAAAELAENALSQPAPAARFSARAETRQAEVKVFYVSLSREELLDTVDPKQVVYDGGVASTDLAANFSQDKLAELKKDARSQAAGDDKAIEVVVLETSLAEAETLLAQLGADSQLDQVAAANLPNRRMARSKNEPPHSPAFGGLGGGARAGAVVQPAAKGDSAGMKADDIVAAPAFSQADGIKANVAPAVDADRVDAPKPVAEREADKKRPEANQEADAEPAGAPPRPAAVAQSAPAKPAAAEPTKPSDPKPFSAPVPSVAPASPPPPEAPAALASAPTNEEPEKADAEADKKDSTKRKTLKEQGQAHSAPGSSDSKLRGPTATRVRVVFIVEQ